MIAGVDFSLNGTGIVLLDGLKVISSYLFTATKARSSEAGVVLIPSNLSQEDRLDWVCSEIIRLTAGAEFFALEQQIGLSFSWADGYGIIKHYNRLRNTPYITIAPTSAKMFAGTGSANKDLMGTFLTNEFGIAFDCKGSDNLVDACWMAIIGEYYYTKYIKDEKITVSLKREEILNKLHIKHCKHSVGNKGR